MNFGELKSYVQDALGRNDIPFATYVLAQDDWDHRLVLPEDQGEAVVPSPHIIQGDALTVIEVRHGGRKLAAAATFPDYDLEGTPDRFIVRTGRIFTWPSTTDDLAVVYSLRFSPRLTNPGDTSTILTRFENVAIYGSLYHACILTRDADGGAIFGAKYEKAIEDAKRESIRAMFGGGALVPVPREVA